MTDLQQPLSSGFGPRSTATDVLEGVDLSGRLAVVTGGYSGLGLEMTRALVGAGASVVVPARRPEAAAEALGALDVEMDAVEVHAMDLADLDSVADVAARLLATGRSIDIVVAGAGIMACPETRIGPGWEAQLAVNHLGHFALVNHLWPALVQNGGARVVSMSSGAHHITAMRWDDLHLESGYDRWVAYGQSKTANVLFAVHLDALGQDRGVRAVAVHPGSILTPLQRHLTTEEMQEAGWIDADGNLADPSFKAPSQGAATAVWAATSPLLDDVGGVYCEDCDVASLAAEGREGGVAAHAIDPLEARRLWEVSAELTGVDLSGVDGAVRAGRGALGVMRRPWVVRGDHPVTPSGRPPPPAPPR